MLELVHKAIAKGAKIYPNISGGKDGQAMVKVLHTNNISMEGFIHADLGRIEWHESMQLCEMTAMIYNRPLHIIKRADGRGMIEHWKNRMMQLAGQNKPFWSSSASRYCTSDLKRDPINKFYRNCGHDLIISAEGIRAGESKARAAKNPFEIRWGITSTYYKDMTPEEAIAAYKPGKRLAITWYPIFNVWNTHDMSSDMLNIARADYKRTGEVPAWWAFHPAYVYGNERVSCVFCVLGCNSDLRVGAKHRPEVLEELIAMEEESGFTFKKDFSLKQLRA
jgi:3'-phosphoadenosine 5'-phosphosulfate sulfotransferase (PAPS reductase)/FAD synthetase